MNLFSNIINKIFYGSNTESVEKSIEEMLLDYDFSTVSEPKICGNLDSKETLIIVDDIELSEMLYDSDFNYIKIISKEENNELDITKKYKIVLCLGNECSLKAYKYIHLDKNPISKAILDISLGEAYKLSDGNYVEINGIDLANFIWLNNTDSDIRLLTAHTMDENNKTINNFINQFKEYTNKDIMEFVINKNNNNRTERLYEFLR